MKNVFIALIVATLSTACVATATQGNKPTYAQLEAENARYRADYAKRQRGGEQPAAPDGDTVAQSGQVSTGTMWARQKHGVYMGAVGEQPRQLTSGRKIKLTNLVCDDGARGFNCEDKDMAWGSDYNTWLSFEIDDQPVVCDSGFFHPTLQLSMLLPTQSCFVEFGAARKVKLTVRFYRNNGNPVSYAMLDEVPYKTIYKIYVVPNGTARLEVDEITSSAY